MGVFFFQNDIIESLEKNLAFHMIFEHSIFFLTGVSLILLNELVLKKLNSSTLLSVKNKDHFYDYSSFFMIRIFIKNWKSLLKIIFSLNKYPLLWLFIAIDIMIFWHIPIFFDLAVLDNFVHILQHISFMIVGLSVFMALRNFGESLHLFLLISLIGMMGLSGVLFSIIGDHIYLVYDIQKHNEAGFYMVLTSIIILILLFPIYLIKRAMIHIKFYKQKI